MRYNTFQSTLPVKGATKAQAVTDTKIEISIHAPGKGSDHFQAIQPTHRAISIHAPGKGSDGEQVEKLGGITEFQSTLPVKGATPTATRQCK